MFGFGQPEFIEENDINQIKKDAITLAKYFTFGTIAGVFINVQIKKIPYINFLNWYRPLRYLARIPLFLLP